jgi:hypothetical protein
MSRAKRKLFAIVSAVAFLLTCGAAGFFFRAVAQRPAPVTGGMVPPSWAEFRTSSGHKAHVGKANIACSDCHGLETNGFTSPGAAICNRCHQDQSAHTHTGGARKTDCLACHSFAPRPAPTCIGCHEAAQGTHAKIAQHATVECRECHEPHRTPSIAPKACTSCHEERALSHATHAQSKDCQDCHHAHEPARAAAQSCASCHERPAGPKPAGHDSCLSCHKPHDFVAQSGRVCVGCHGVKPTLVATTAPAHTRCTSCHMPHAPAQAASSCAGCHDQVHVVHAGKQACIGCHSPHGGDANAKANSCTSCHAQVAASDTGAHAAGRTACTSCHKPHDFPAPARGALCQSCHGDETRLASDNRGHQDCTSCHGASAHHPASAPACSTCHTKEAGSAPRGHLQCGSCHEPHGGGRVPQAVSCTSCHANKASALHANLQGGCETCHRPHGPNGVATPPPCASCHERRTLPALHALAPHGDCSQCHSSHGPPRSDRETCTSTCHLARRNHQPTAQICTGCHVFRN